MHYHHYFYILNTRLTTKIRKSSWLECNLLFGMAEKSHQCLFTVFPPGLIPKLLYGKLKVQSMNTLLRPLRPRMWPCWLEHIPGQYIMTQLSATQGKHTQGRHGTYLSWIILSNFMVSSSLGKVISRKSIICLT